MIRLSWLFFLFLVIISCRNDETPRGIMEKEKMERVLWDMLRADEWVAYEMNLDTSVDRHKRTLELYSQVYSIHKTNLREFKKSFRYYESHPELLKPVLDSMQKKGSTYPMMQSLPAD
jgi:hypothetical protein